MCVVQKHLSFTSATAEGSTRTVSPTKDPTERGDSRLKTQDSRRGKRTQEDPVPTADQPPREGERESPTPGAQKQAWLPAGAQTTPAPAGIPQLRHPRRHRHPRLTTLPPRKRRLRALLRRRSRSFAQQRPALRLQQCDGTSPSSGHHTCLSKAGSLRGSDA